MRARKRFQPPMTAKQHTVLLLTDWGQDGIKLAFEMKEFEYPYMQKDIFKEKVSFCQIGVISYFTRVMFCLRNDDFRACIVSVIIISSWLEQSSSI